MMTTIFRILADDIKRNGLMHNLVVFQAEEEGREAWILLSGVSAVSVPRGAIEGEGDTSWSVVRNCNDNHAAVS